MVDRAARPVLSGVFQHWWAFCAGRPSSDGWVFSRRYRAVAIVLLVLAGVSVVRGIAADRGVSAAAVLGLVWFFSVWVVATGHQAAWAGFQRRHPYLEAAFSIPYAVLLALVLLPRDWPVGVLVAIGAAFVTFSFLGGHRRHRQRRDRQRHRDRRRPRTSGDRH